MAFQFAARYTEFLGSPLISRIHPLYPHRQTEDVAMSEGTQTASRRSVEGLPWFDRQILAQVAVHGGMWNAHAHLDRANTLDPEFLADLGRSAIELSRSPLAVKQNLVGDLHRGPAYTPENLYNRMRAEILRQIALGVVRLDTNIDATPDIGLTAIEIALKLREEFAGMIDLRVAPTPIFGFKEEEREHPSRWEIFCQAAAMCQYLSLLPEKDDPDGRGRIGFKPHCHRGLALARDLGKEIQFHTDQGNHPDENGTEQLIEVLEGFEQPTMPGEAPWVWVIHMISPSAYPEDRFLRLVNRLLKQRVGVIVCPTAALSMRQYRSLDAPIHNSIARLLELIKCGVPIRIGTDNINDVFVPQGDGDLLTEAKVGGLATRMNEPSIWAKLLAGVKLNNVDIDTIGNILYQERRACLGANPDWKPAVQ